VKNYFFWRELNSFLNVDGKSKYEIASRRVAVLHLFTGDNHSEVAESLDISVRDVENDIAWNHSNRKNYANDLSKNLLKLP